MILLDIFDWEEIPIEFLFLTIPALVLVIMGLLEKKDVSKQKFFDMAVGISALGFIWTLATMLGRLSAASEKNNFF